MRSSKFVEVLMVNDLEQKIKLQAYSHKKARDEAEDFDRLYDIARAHTKDNPEFSWAVYQKIIDEGMDDLLKFYYSRRNLKRMSNLIASARYNQVFTEPYIKFHFSEKEKIDRAINRTKELKMFKRSLI